MTEKTPRSICTSCHGRRQICASLRLTPSLTWLAICFTCLAISVRYGNAFFLSLVHFFSWIELNIHLRMILKLKIYVIMCKKWIFCWFWANPLFCRSGKTWVSFNNLKYLKVYWMCEFCNILRFCSNLDFAIVLGNLWHLSVTQS